MHSWVKVISRDHGGGLVCHLGAFFQGYLVLQEAVHFAATASYVVSLLAITEILVCFGARWWSSWISE